MPNFSGVWTLQSQMQAIAAGTWAGVPTQLLFSWGTDDSGQNGFSLAYATGGNKSSPVQLGAQTDWALANKGSGHSIAIKTNGTLWAWGGNFFGGLGHNDTVYRSSPVQVGALTAWAQVVGGSFMCAAIKTNGTLWTWGRNSVGGELGQNNTINRSSPVQVGALTDWAQVSSGRYNCAAVKTNGTLFTWGTGVGGQLGINDRFTFKSSPVQVGALTDWSQISCGGSTFACVKTNGTLFSWGSNSYGEVGDNTNISRSSPVQVGALTDWAQVSAGNDHCVGIKTTGTIWSWGRNGNGQLGLGFAGFASINNRSSPVQIGALTNWSQVAARNSFCLAIKTDGTLWSWGTGNPLGHNDTVSRSSPVQIGSLNNWTSISQGSLNGLASFAILSL